MEELNKEYWDSGEIQRETPLYNGKKHGIEKFYYTNGKKRSEFTYVNGLSRGVIRTWYSNSEIRCFATVFFRDIHGISIKLIY